MSKIIAQHRIAVALVGAVALLAVLLALSSFVAGHAVGRTVASRPPLSRDRPTLVADSQLWRNA